MMMMADHNLAAVLVKQGDIRLEKRPIPEPGRHEVLLGLRAVGVCATDVHYWKDGGIGENVKVDQPVILGHEMSGVVCKLGEGVTHLNVGDRVAIEPVRVCRVCPACSSGKYNTCPQLAILSMPPNDGGLQQYLVHNAAFVYKLPDNVSFEEAALIEPFSVGLYACRRARVQAGDTLVISGAGPVGICMLLAARAHGATTVMLTDLDPSRLEFAKKMGATHTLLLEKTSSVKDVAREIRAVLGGRSPDKVVECCGAEAAVQVAVEVVKPGGVISIVGVGEAYVRVPMVDIIVKNIDLVATAAYNNTWPAALGLISSGQCDVAPLVSHRFELQDIQAAFTMVDSCVGMKVIVNCNQE